MSGRSMHIWISCWPEAEKRLPNSLWTRGRRWRILSSEWKNISEECWKKLEKIVENEMLSTEEIRGSMEITEKGRIRQSIQNCKHVFEHDPCLKGAICRNEMTGQIDIKKKVPWKRRGVQMTEDRKSTRLNSSHVSISYAVFCLKK